MILRDIISSKAVHWVSFHNIETGLGYGPDVVRKIKERYEFVSVSDLALSLPPKNDPLTFTHGRFRSPKGEIVVRNLQYFANGLVAVTGAHVEDSDMFLQGVTEWLEQEFKLECRKAGKAYRVYESELEIKIDKDPLLVPPGFSKAVRLVNEILINNGHAAAFKPTGMHAGYDVLQYPQPAHKPMIAFVLERRANQPFEENIFYSRAPLNTADHLAILKAIEG